MQKSETQNPKTRIEKVTCPFCESPDTEMLALFGQQMLTTQYFCRHCRSAFEAVKWQSSSSE